MNEWRHRILKAITAVLQTLAFGIFVLFILAGLGKMAQALWAAWQGLSHPEDAHSVNPITIALHGLELMFLAPLPAALIYSADQWLIDIFWGDPPRTYPPGKDPDTLLTHMKVKVLHLMAAIVAAELVNAATNREGANMIHYEFTFCALLIVVVLCAYGILLQRQPSHAPQEEKGAPKGD